MPLECRVKAYIDQHHLLEKGEKYLVALSGGADSVALLLLLSRMGYDVEAVHCNFNLRGEEALRDENFCLRLCQRLGIVLHRAHFDTRSYASLHKVSIEMAARELRYAYFESLRRDLDMAGICVAHHNDDNVETVLINLVRGTGLHGLTGMSPRNGHILRPLLCVDRQDIVRYLQRMEQPYVTDSSNLTNDVVRNKLRLDVIPLLKKINPAVVGNISKTIHRLDEASKMLDNALDTAIQKVVLHREKNENKLPTSLSLSIEALQRTPSPEYTLFHLIKDFGFTPAQIEQIATNRDLQTGKRWTSATHTLVIDRGKLLLRPTLSQEEQSREMRIPEEGTYVFKPNERFYVTSGTASPTFQPSKEPCLVHLDKEKVRFPLTVRHLREGDRFVPFGMKGSMLVSDYLTNGKRSFFDRQCQLVLTDADGCILWLVGQRTDNRFRIDTTTTTYLQIAFEKREEG